MKLAILGGGQLARMLAVAAHRLEIEPWVVDPKPDAPAAAVANHVLGALDDPASWRAVAHCDVATAEIDHAPPRALAWLERRMPVRPGPSAFSVAGDRLAEKNLFQLLGIPTAPWLAADSLPALEKALDEIGLPAVVKTRSEGYDGRGQRILRERHEAAAAWKSLGERPVLVERHVPFDREVSLLAVRSAEGEVRFWSPVENRHREGILRTSQPFEPGSNASVVDQGREAVRALVEALDYVGVIAVEFFELGGRLIANEIACRVHNSGHWTEDAAETGQFENHVRAVAGLPLGGTRLLGPAALVNLIGRASPERWLRTPGARVHLYGKSPAPGRKLGHVTLRASSSAELDATLAAVGSSVTPLPFPPMRRSA